MFGSTDDKFPLCMSVWRNMVSEDRGHFCRNLVTKWVYGWQLLAVVRDLQRYLRKAFIVSYLKFAPLQSYIHWANLSILKTKSLWTECFVLFPCQATLTLWQMCTMTCPGSSSPNQSISEIWLRCTTASSWIMSLDIFIIGIRLCFCPDTESRFCWDIQKFRANWRSCSLNGKSYRIVGKILNMHFC